MNINIKTSEQSQKLIRDLSAKLRLPSENTIARIALSYSLSKGRILENKKPADSKGKEYKEDTFFGKHKTTFVALVCQLYQKYKSDNDIPKLIKMHVDDGLELMEKFFESNPNHNVYDFLIETIDRGVEAIEHSNNPMFVVANTNRQIGDKSLSDKLWKIYVGNDKDGERIVLQPNNTTTYNNCHMAIAGTSGSGKTQLALELLTQIIEQTNNKTNFVYLDFKGLNTEDEKKLDKFFKTTKTQFINAPHTSIPLNPFAFIDNVNQVNMRMGINKFVDIICDYSNAGNNQKQNLRDSVYSSFANITKGKYPTMVDLERELPNHFQKMPNTISEVIGNLAGYNIFTEETNKDFFNQNYYFSLGKDLDNSIRFTSTFLVINYIFNTFMSMPDAPVNNGVRSMRYVLLIDEAQVIFRDKKAQLVLQQILEQVRSKGVAVILLAQNISEFDQPNFNFSSLCEIGFLFKITDLTNNKKIAKFLGLSEAETKLVARGLEKIQPGQAVSNMKEFRKGELFSVAQFHKRK